MEQQAGSIDGAMRENKDVTFDSFDQKESTPNLTNFNKSLPLESDINTNPPIASDDDLIEKEWVERAKKLVEETHGDPYKQDEEINKLQADYVNKRYSKKLGSL